MVNQCICESKTTELCCPGDEKIREKWLVKLKKEHSSIKHTSKEIAGKLKLFSNPIRLEILLMLEQRENCMEEISRKLMIPKPALSYHLKLLKNKGMICVKKRSRFAFYSLSHSGMKAITALK
jgi:ArsR family transcriptional regulator